jgi:dCTP deaminase
LLLSRRDILTQIRRGRLRFDPKITESQVSQVSVDLHIGRRFSKFKDIDQISCITAVRVDPSIWGALDIWEETEAESFVIRPREFVLAQTLESVHMPNDLGGLIEGRSRYARLGIGMHVTAPKIDPGFEGVIALEVFNNGSLPIELVAGKDTPAQLMLFKLSRPLTEKELYGAGEEDIFQGQATPIPTKRRSSKNQPKRK